MPELDARTVADLLDELGDRLELSGESPFKIRAYRKGAELLRALHIPLATLVAERRLQDLPGIGEALAEKITSLQQTGSHPTLEHLRRELPAGLLDLMRLPGLGPKKVMLLHREAGVRDMAELETAILAGRLAAVKGFGSQTQVKLLEALGFLRASMHRMLLPRADFAIEGALSALRARPEVSAASAAGEARRRCETVAGPCVVVAAREPARLPTHAGPGDLVRVVAVRPESYAMALLQETGAASHVTELAELAEQRELTWNRDGLFCGLESCAASEEEIYRELQLPFIPPELREGRGEIQAAKQGRQPRLLEPEEIRGLLHVHSTYSDGAHSIEAMAEAVRALGMTYLGVADHSRSAGYAGGLKEDRVLRQHEEIDQLNARYAREHPGRAFHIFKGIESDIREDGALDYPEEFLARFDFIVASVHSLFELDLEHQTERMLQAVAHPATTFLGHPTGRRLLKRPSYRIDLERVILACAQHGVALEINAHPVRLDLDWRWHRQAQEAGALFSINPDSHNAAELSDYRFGVSIARKGGVRAQAVLNCKELPAISDYFEGRKKKWAGNRA